MTLMTPALLLCLIAASVAAGEPCANQVGFAVLVGQPAERALALARRGWMVQALADEAGCIQLRQTGETAGVLGRSLWVGRWTGSIPIADQTADLIEGPAAIDAEARRVLIPGLGAGIIGGQILRVPRPATWDGWSHWLHGADNNPVSADTGLTLPTRLAWLGRPQRTVRSASGRVAADGRMFLTTGVNEFGQDAPGVTSVLTAHSLHNGTLLWRRDLPKGMRTARCNLIARDGRLLLLDGGSVLHLDAATGMELRRFTVAEGRELKWMGSAGDALVVLAGATEPPYGGFFPDAANKQKRLQDGSLGHGDELICLDAATGTGRWQVKSTALIDGRAVCISAGLVVYHAPMARIAAIDLATGRERWGQTDPAVLEPAGGARRGAFNVGLEERPGMMANGTIVLLDLPDIKRTMSLSLKDGSLLWSKDSTYGVASNALIVDGKVFTNAHGGSFTDAVTGSVTKAGVWLQGCGVISATPTTVFSNTSGPRFDLTTNKAVDPLPIKAQCQVGTFVADGRLIAPAMSCLCYVVQGHVVLASSNGGLPDAQDAQRLHAGRHGTDAPVAQAPGDWPTIRADNRRSGYAPVDIPRLQLRWLTAPATPFPTVARPDWWPWAPDTEWRSTPPVGLGDLVVVAASDGSVRAYDAGSGKPRWTHWSEGPVMASPTIAHGRVYIGSGDGTVTCLSAADGTLRWRFRAAPDERRIPVYGLLQSSWPVNSGVLVEGDTAYAVAGMALSPPTTVYALDAKTGAIRWAQRGDWAPNGGLAIIGGRLWARTFGSPGIAMRFNLQDGSIDKDQIAIGGMRGPVLAQVAPELLMYGGGDTYRDVANRHATRSEGVAAVSLGADGRPRLPGIRALYHALMSPAGDGALVVTVGQEPIDTGCGGTGDEWIEGWDATRSRVETDVPAATIGDLAKMPQWQLNSLPRERTRQQIDASSQRLWGPLPLTVRGVAMAKNAVVALGADRPTTKSPRGPWRLLILDRGTGATIQDLPLPGEPAADGLCLTRDGGVVVTLRDGGVVGFGPAAGR